MPLDDKVLAPEEIIDPAFSFDKMLSDLEETNPKVISIIEKIKDKSRRLYFKRFEIQTRARWIFLGSSAGHKAIIWEKYNLPLSPNEYLPDSSYNELIEAYNKKDKNISKSKAI